MVRDPRLSFGEKTQSSFPSIMTTLFYCFVYYIKESFCISCKGPPKYFCRYPLITNFCPSVEILTQPFPFFLIYGLQIIYYYTGTISKVLHGQGWNWKPEKIMILKAHANYLIHKYTLVLRKGLQLYSKWLHFGEEKG